jgi:hypothetical protein
VLRPTVLVFKNRTVSSVFRISGSLSFNPTTRRCRFCSINWYFLHPPQPNNVSAEYRPSLCVLQFWREGAHAIIS